MFFNSSSQFPHWVGQVKGRMHMIKMAGTRLSADSPDSESNEAENSEAMA